MTELAYHASHEQFAPSHLLQLVQQAERAGFDAIHSSDHFHPWSVRQGHSGYTFSWIAAALQATKLPFSMVCAPGQRYHPAIVAQAIATLAEMFPNRFAIELGSGEALNEHITGTGWPEKNIRNERLKECADVIRALLNGEEVTYHGHITVHEARLFTLPKIRPLLFCAALGEETSGWCGSWADGLLTTTGSLEQTLKKRDAFFKNGGEGKPFFLQFSFSYARKREDAVQGAFDQWRSSFVGMEKLASIYKTEQFDEATKDISSADVEKSTLIVTRMDELWTHIERWKSIGASRIVLHNLNRMHEDFINDFAASYGSHNTSG